MPQFNEAFLFLAPGRSPADAVVRESGLARTRFIPAADASEAAAVAAGLRAQGVDLIELYGGFGQVAAASVLAATDGAVPVGMVGAEQDRSPRLSAVIYVSDDADPVADRRDFEHDGGRIAFVPVADADAVGARAVALADEGAERIELCGGLGPVPAAAAIAALDGRAAVVSVAFGMESLAGAAAYSARYEQAYEQLTSVS